MKNKIKIFTRKSMREEVYSIINGRLYMVRFFRRCDGLTTRANLAQLLFHENRFSHDLLFHVITSGSFSFPWGKNEVDIRLRRFSHECEEAIRIGKGNFYDFFFFRFCLIDEEFVFFLLVY